MLRNFMGAEKLTKRPEWHLLNMETSTDKLPEVGRMSLGARQVNGGHQRPDKKSSDGISAQEIRLTVDFLRWSSDSIRFVSAALSNIE
jgi:hypothetical protein